MRFVVNTGFEIISFFVFYILDVANTDLLEKLGYTPRDEGIADSMESIFAEAMLLGHFLINRECMDARRYSLVKGCVKPRY
jgi:hypothetical protein